MATIRELEEEIGIKGPTMEFWKTDKQFNCDIYLYELEGQEIIERMELEKNSEWRFYTLEEWKKFKIFTNYAVLKTLMNHENLSGRRYRWMEKLNEYNFDIEYRSGKKMEQADCLSRINHIQIEVNDK